ncbi:hypothetical protein NA56DRAFT_710305 [Hyaloscypha hepaticicola]|uniref:Uncharacterized protein n=1 Tax=Hyaloscypha hepaticicola TaxID=2082293 RepID=A0A2J6PM29_9HELO|nr:hypothetical protein NA56DRAFT_710305 [Hyaloscypha hepaticicola]
MLNTIKKRERAALYRAGITARRCEKLKREVILDGDIPLSDLSYAMAIGYSSAIETPFVTTSSFITVSSTGD